ncbi:hypothetical protein V4D30_01155 [Thermodesulfovibrio sp. 3907-1M]|uniref:Uncharacterized protein n=1 Tax=Thermodesulfovibrio autotrophicus TaxID=3118333 RepID=A0AAU8GWQ6_9BACT
MLTKETIKEIIKESPLIVLFTPQEVENVVEEIYNKYINVNKTDVDTTNLKGGEHATFWFPCR